MISRSQMKRQLYSIGGGAIKGTDAGNGREGFFRPVFGGPKQNSPLAGIFGGSGGMLLMQKPRPMSVSSQGGQKPIYPRISDIEASLSGAEQRIGDPSLGSSSGTSDGGFGSPMGGVYSGSMGGELPNEQPGLPPIQQITNPNLQNLINQASWPGMNTIQQAIQQGPLQIPSTLINPVRPGVDTSQLGSPRSGGMGSAFGQLSSLFGGVGDPRLGAPDVPNSLQQIMRGGAADGGLMNRQLYNMGGEGIMQVAPQQDSMPSDMQAEQYRPIAENLANDPKQAIEVIVKMLMEQGIPEEEARRIAMEMIQTVAQTGSLEEFEDDERVEARFGGRIGYADGGIGSLVNREQYGFGSFVKGIVKGVKGAVKGVTNAVKSVVKSPIGKIALTAAAMYYAPMAFGQAPGLAGYQSGWGALKSGLLGNPAVGDFGTMTGSKGLLGSLGLSSGYGATPSLLGSLSSLIPEKGTLLSAGAGFLGGMFAGGAKPPKPEDFPSNEEYLAAVAEYENMYGSNLAGTSTTLPSSANNPFYATTTYKADGGRIGYAYGSVDQGIMAAPQIADMMGMPVGNPRQNQQGVAELDYRDQGGFVPPIGVKERADDIPAMLSNNEFVFTADAVKNAGGGDPNIGAQKMYTLMKRLESGGMV
jgi:hypothetical protein